MTYGVLYEFERTSTNGADIRITIRQKWYEGEVKKRALGRAPVIKRDNNGHIYGTSCEIYAECLVDGEFSQLYTSDAFEFRVDVYRNEILIWQGFVSPELYSEPDIAPPYDVQIIATDGLGELKNYNFEKRGVASILSHIDYLMSKSGVGMAFNVVSGLRYINSQGVLSAEKDILNININLDHEEGNSCYDVLQNILSSLNANITQHNGRYLIFRETDFINKASDDTVEAFDVNGTRVDLPIASFGSIQSHQWWPIGQLSTVIEPAKNEVILKSPDFYKNNGLSDWNLNAGALYDDKENAYSLPSKSSSISQTLDFGVELGYRLGLRVRARNVGAGKWGIGESSEEQNLGVKVEMHGRAIADNLGNQFWLVKSEGIASGSMFSDYIWSTNDAAIGCEMSLPSAEQTAADAQNIDIVIPLFDDGTHTYGSYAYADQLKITIFNPDGIHKIYVYDVSLVKYEQTGGYEADVIINNAAREGASDIDLAMTAGDRAPEAGAVFMTGLPLQAATKNVITQWQTGNDTQDYLSAMAYDYSRAIALPKMKYSGSLNVPGSATVLPTLFLRDGTYYFPKTYSYDLYNDEMSVELISISAADVSLAAVIISQYAQPSETMGASTTGTASPGGTAISFPRDTEMSETSDNAVENKVIKKYVDDLRDQLLDLWNLDENGNLVTDKQVLIKKNLIVSGDTSSGGSGSDTPALGTVTGIQVGPTSTDILTPNNAGIIDMVSVLSSIDVSDQLANYLPLSGGTLSSANVPLSLNRTSGIVTIDYKSDGTTVGYMGFDQGGRPIMRPQAQTNSTYYDILHSGNFHDFALPLSGGTIKNQDIDILTINRNGGGSVSSIAFKGNDALFYGYLGFDAVDNPVWMDSAYNRFPLLHSGNYSSYALPLSGGEVKGTYPYQQNILTLDTDNVYYTILRFKSAGVTKGRLQWADDANHFKGFGLTNDTTGDRLGLSDSGTPFYNGNTLIHSGNIGEYAVVKNGWVTTTDINSVGAIEGVGAYACFGDGNYRLIFRNKGTNGLQYQGWNGSALTDWKIVAFTDSNVASATKLQTARTIWGKSFDGTADITGDLYLPNNTNIYVVNAAGTAHYSAMYLSTNNGLTIGNGVASAGYNTLISGNNIYLRYGTSRTNGLILNSSGNVTFGGSDLAGTSAKLYVDGSVSLNGEITFSATKNKIDSYGNIYIDEVNTAWFVNAGSTYASSTPIIWVERASKNVGVNTTSPAYKLDVNGSTRITSNIFAGLVVHRTGAASTMGSAIALSTDYATLGVMGWNQYNEFKLQDGEGNKFFYGGKDGMTITSKLSVDTLTITNQGAPAHIKFSRGGFNYIDLPYNGTLAFTFGVQSQAGSTLYMSEGQVNIKGNLVVSGDIAAA